MSLTKGQKISEKLKSRWQDPSYREHMSSVHLGQKAWNKGRACSEETKKKLSISLRGRRNSPDTEFKIGRKDEKHPEWKGGKASYSAIHHWVKRWKGKPGTCEECGFVGICTWANIDHKYKRVLDDYISLCRKCHYAYDVKHNGRKSLFSFTKRYANKYAN